jgi:hypothetical protein
MDADSREELMASQEKTVSNQPLGSPAAQSEEEKTVPADVWLGSRASIMLLVSVILILVATTIMYFSDQRMSLGWQILRPIADAMLVVAVTVILTELGPFRSYVEERLQALKQVLDRPLFDRLNDATYLRANFSPERIREMQRASTCASLPAHIKDYPEFLKVIEKSVIPLAAETIWRRDFRLNLTHTLHERRDGQTFLRQKSTLSATYFNTGNGERSFNIPIVREYSKLPGFPDEQLCCNGWATLLTEGAVNETKIPLTFSPTDLGDSVRFEATFRVSVGTRPVFVSTGYESIVGPSETYRVSFSVPTTGVAVTYQHPAEVRPKLYCFNLGGELKAIVKEDTLHQWEHSGTFLPNHGAVLTHSLARRVGEKFAAQKAGSPVERRRA